MKTYFEETQSLRDSRWLWIPMIVVGTGTLLPLLYALYWQIGQGEPWGNEPMSDNGLIGLTIYLMITLGVLGWIFFSMKLEIRIDTLGLHYKFFPNKPRWTLISMSEIDCYEIRKKVSPFETGIGFRRNWFKHTKSINISGCEYLQVTLTNREKIRLGTRDPQGIERAMKKMMDHNESN